MGKCKNATKGCAGAQKDVSPTPLFHGGEAGDTGNSVQDLMPEVGLLEKVLLQMGASSKMLFRFTQSSRLPSKLSLPPEHWWDCSMTPNDCMCVCIHLRVTLGEGRGNQPPPSHAWSGFLIADILQEACPKDWITKAIVLSLPEAILFFGRCSLKEGLHYWKVKDIELGLRGSFNWAGKPVQIEVTVKTMQEFTKLLQMLSWKRKLRPGGQDVPKDDESNLDPHHNIQHWRVDERLGRRSLQWGSEKWWSRQSQTWMKKHLCPACWLSSRQHRWQEKP